MGDFFFSFLRAYTIISMNISQNWWFFKNNCWITNFFFAADFLKLQSFCISILFFQQNLRLTVVLKTFLEANLFKMHNFFLFFSSKTGKIHDIPLLNSEFSDEIHLIPCKIEKLSPLIGSKKLPWTLKNCPALHKNHQIFQKRWVSCH